MIVTIFGGAGAGKSQLAKAVAMGLGEGRASRVPVDWFLVPREEDETMTAFLARPLAYDWALVRVRLSLPAGARTSTPDMDFGTFARRADTGGLPLTIRPVMICDAMVPCPDADVSVRLDVPESVRYERVVERDVRWGSRVQDRWAYLETTWHASRCAKADIVLDGTLPLAENTRHLVEFIWATG